jgi:hypothetical protein
MPGMFMSEHSHFFGWRSGVELCSDILCYLPPSDLYLTAALVYKNCNMLLLSIMLNLLIR